MLHGTLVLNQDALLLHYMQIITQAPCTRMCMGERQSCMYSLRHNVCKEGKKSPHEKDLAQ